MTRGFVLAVGMLVLGLGNVLAASPGSETVSEEKTEDSTIKVKPGERKGNGDVTVTNHSDKADAKIEGPKAPNNTTVTTEKDFAGVITGVDEGDTVDLGLSQNDVEIFATGGNVIVQKQSNVTIQVKASSGSNGVTVTMPDKSTVTVKSGSISLKT